MKHKMLRMLPTSMLDQVETLLRKGTAAKEVARVIKFQWNEFPNVKMDAMEKAVQYFRDDLFIGNTVNLLMQIGALDRITLLGKKVDALDELYKLVHLQKRRLDRAIAVEDHHKIAGVNATVQIKLLSELLVKVAEMQMETGIMPRASKNVTVVPPSDTGDVFRFTEEQGRVLETIKQIANGKDKGEAEVYDTRR